MLRIRVRRKNFKTGDDDDYPCLEGYGKVVVGDGDTAAAAYAPEAQNVEQSKPSKSLFRLMMKVKECELESVARSNAWNEFQDYCSSNPLDAESTCTCLINRELVKHASPLHFLLACRNFTDVPFKVVRKLCAAYPAAVLIQNGAAKETPLHLVLCRPISFWGDEASNGGRIARHLIDRMKTSTNFIQSATQLPMELVQNHVVDMLGNPLSNCRDYRDHTILHNLLRKRAPFDLVKRLLDAAPQTAYDLCTDPTYLKVKGFTPLHFACYHGDKISKQVIQKLIEMNPGALTTNTSELGTPLLIACGICDYVVAPFEVVELILNSAREAVSMTLRNSILPLHMAVFSGASTNILRLLLDAFPESLSKSCLATNSLPLHLACMRNSSLATIQLLVERYPVALATGDVEDSVPLHHACFCKTLPIDTVEYLVHQYPEAKLAANRGTLLPVQMVPLDHPHRNEILQLLE